jgi:hypothetical protein
VVTSLFELSWRLLRGGGRRGLLGAGLTLAAVAVSTGLLLFAVGANHAFGQRADADAWRHPKASGHATAVEALSTDYVRGRPISVIDLAALSPDAPVPPGLATFPAAGQVWVSPGLADLMKTVPGDQLADRFPHPAGTLGRSALVHPGELVAVVGRAPTDPAMTGTRPSDGDGTASPVKIAGYQTGAVSSAATMYTYLVLIATVLMVVPLLVFGGAAARLTVARRDQRLAALRLVGARPGQVVALTVIEAVLTAVGGAVVGAVLYAAAIPALTQIRIAGGTWFGADLWPGILPVLGTLVAVPLLVGASAVVGLRRVVVSPLGVARRTTPPRLRVIRLVVFVAILIGFGVAGSTISGLNKAGLVIMMVFLALAFLGITLVGPWVVSILGRIVAGTARRPATLLAGRRLVDDPRSAWRTVSGVALTGFVAGFLALLSVPAGHGASSTRLELTVPKAQVSVVTGEARQRLAAASIPGQVTSSTPTESLETMVVVHTQEVDRARTALAGLVPGRVATTPADDQVTSGYIVADLRTGALTVLVVSILIAITSAGITAASSVLDRRQMYALLRLAGTPLSVLDKARRQETLIPLAVMGGGSLVTGLFFALPFARFFGASGLVTLLVLVVLGTGGIVAAGALSRPLLRSVTADPAPRPD